jgi:RNA polymerase sigma factor (sigma-70 family)
MPAELLNDINLLWASFLKGDDKAFSGIYCAYADPLFCYGKKITSDREILLDSIQEVFLDLYQKRGKEHQPILNPKAYLFIAVKNCIVRKVVQSRKFDEKKMNDDALGEFNIEYSFQDQQINQEIQDEKNLRLQKAILDLSPKQKEIIFLKFDQGLDYKVIAELMNITIESARKQLYRALLVLRETLDSKTFYTFLSIFSKK